MTNFIENDVEYGRLALELKWRSWLWLHSANSEQYLVT